MSQPTIHRVRVRYGDTDMMGHAYYANYLYWFEEARGAWCRDRGFTYQELEESGYKLPVVEVGAKYHGEAKYDDWVSVHVWLDERRRASIKFAYRLVNERTGDAITEGFTWHVFVGSTMKAVTIPSEISDLLERDPADHPTLP